MGLLTLRLRLFFRKQLSSYIDGHSRGQKISLERIGARENTEWLSQRIKLKINGTNGNKKSNLK